VEELKSLRKIKTSAWTHVALIVTEEGKTKKKKKRAREQKGAGKGV
jgi:hypothetical protein